MNIIIGSVVFRIFHLCSPCPGGIIHKVILIPGPRSSVNPARDCWSSISDCMLLETLFPPAWLFCNCSVSSLKADSSFSMPEISFSSCVMVSTSVWFFSLVSACACAPPGSTPGKQQAKNQGGKAQIPLPLSIHGHTPFQSIPVFAQRARLRAGP